MHSRIITSVAAGIVVQLTAGSSFAAPASYCRDYANQAVISATQNMSHGCGFTGLRWIANYQVHYNWCIGARYEDAVQERALRAQGIVACHGGPTHYGRW